MKQNQILKIYGKEYKVMTKEILRKSDLLSLIIDKKSFVGRDPRICIKPNLVVPTPAIMGATTHTEIVEGIVEYLRECGFENIVIAEGCWLGEKMEDCIEYTGFGALCERLNVPFRNIREYGSHTVDCAGMEIKVSDAINDVDFLINVPVVKGHCQVQMTCALKNVKGLVPDSEKRRFHALGINKPVGHLSASIHQDFIVADNICGDLEFEEGGNPVEMNCVMTALDPVLLDSYVCDMLGLTPDDVSYVRIAESLGIGSADLSTAEVIEVNETLTDSKLPSKSRVLDVAYAVEDLESCSECYANLIPALLKLKDEGLFDKLDTKIAIGQNHKGKTGRLGVGKCTAGYEKCIMGCPPDKDYIYKQLKAYILEK